MVPSALGYDERRSQGVPFSTRLRRTSFPTNERRMCLASAQSFCLLVQGSTRANKCYADQKFFIMRMRYLIHVPQLLPVWIRITVRMCSADRIGAASRAPALPSACALRHVLLLLVFSLPEPRTQTTASPHTNLAVTTSSHHLCPAWRVRRCTNVAQRVPGQFQQLCPALHVPNTRRVICT